MTNRELLLASLSGEPTDRVPVWLLFPYHNLSCYVDVRTHPGYVPVFEASRKYACMLNRRRFTCDLHTPEVRRSREQLTDGATAVTRDWVEYKGKRICSEYRKGPDGASQKRLLRSPEDLEFFASLPLNTDPAAITAQLDSQLPAYLREREEFPMEYGAMMLDLGEPVGVPYGCSDLEEFALWSLTHDDLMVSLLDRLMERYRIVYQWCLDRNLADVYFTVGSELAAPPMVSRATFQRWVVPYAQELIAMAHRHGAKVIQHFHGQIREILPDFLTMGADGLHTIESPPVGNCTWPQAWEVVGDRMTLIGNIQYDDFRRLSEQEMAQAVRDVLDQCRGRRLILSPSAGPYEKNVSEQFLRNYIVFMETAWSYPWK